MSQGKEDLKQIHLALIAAQESGGGGLFKFLQETVDILSDFAGLRLNKMILTKWPAYAATGNLGMDKNARWLLGRLTPHLWKIRVEPAELIQSFREGTGRLGHLPDGVLRALHGILDSSMVGWRLEEKFWDKHAEAHIDFYHFPPLEEAREIFAAKHGDVVWPETDEVAMVEVRRVEAEEAAAEAEWLRQSDGINVIIREYRDPANLVKRRIREAEMRYGITREKAAENRNLNAEEEAARKEFLRVTADDRSAMDALDARFAEQRRRNEAAEALLGPDDVWPPEQGA